jgi:hypothetical protein
MAMEHLYPMHTISQRPAAGIGSFIGVELQAYSIGYDAMAIMSGKLDSAKTILLHSGGNDRLILTTSGEGLGLIAFH